METVQPWEGGAVFPVALIVNRFHKIQYAEKRLTMRELRAATDFARRADVTNFDSKT